MIETGPILGKYEIKEVQDSLTQQTLLLVDSKGKVIAKHEIYSLSNNYARKESSTHHSDFFYSPPLHFYTGRIDSYLNEQGIGLALWQYGERYFYYNCEKPYYRMIRDISKTHWTERHMPELLEDLALNSIPVKTIWEEVNQEGQYMCLLLFEDLNEEE